MRRALQPLHARRDQIDRELARLEKKRRSRKRRRYYGSGREWTRKEHQLLCELWADKRVEEIAVLLNRTRASVKSRAEKLGLRKGNRKFWTPQEDRILRARYATESSPVLAKHFGCTVYQVYCRAHRLGLAKNPEFLLELNRRLSVKLAESGRAHRFPKGHAPANKGLRMPGYAPGRMRETQFKKGQRIYHQRNVGEQRLCDGYLYTKIAETPCIPWTRNWKLTHILIWEKAHGPVPPKHAVCFKDGDRTHVTLDNLELIHRRELLRRNQAHIPPELKQVIQLTGALKRSRRRRDGEKQDVRSAGSLVRDAGAAEGRGEAARG